METTEIQVEKYSGYDNNLLQIRSEREAATELNIWRKSQV